MVFVSKFFIEIFVQSDDFDKVGLIVSFNKIDLLAVGKFVLDKTLAIDYSL